MQIVSICMKCQVLFFLFFFFFRKNKKKYHHAELAKGVVKVKPKGSIFSREMGEFIK